MLGGSRMTGWQTLSGDAPRLLETVAKHYSVGGVLFFFHQPNPVANKAITTTAWAICVASLRGDLISAIKIMRAAKARTISAMRRTLDVMISILGRGGVS
jgi:hypothetical protein